MAQRGRRLAFLVCSDAVGKNRKIANFASSVLFGELGISGKPERHICDLGKQLMNANVFVIECFEKRLVKRKTTQNSIFFINSRDFLTTRLPTTAGMRVGKHS